MMLAGNCGSSQMSSLNSSYQNERVLLVCLFTDIHLLLRHRDYMSCAGAGGTAAMINQLDDI